MAPRGRCRPLRPALSTCASRVSVRRLASSSLPSPTACSRKGAGTVVSAPSGPAAASVWRNSIMFSPSGWPIRAASNIAVTTSVAVGAQPPTGAAGGHGGGRIEMDRRQRLRDPRARWCRRPVRRAAHGVAHRRRGVRRRPARRRTDARRRCPAVRRETAPRAAAATATASWSPIRSPIPAADAQAAMTAGSALGRPQQVAGPQFGDAEQLDLDRRGDADGRAAAECPERFSIKRIRWHRRTARRSRPAPST